MFTTTTTSRGGTLYLDENQHGYYKKKDNHFVCVDYLKLKCPATARLENEDFIVTNIHNHSSARMKAKIIKKEVMDKALSSSDAQPLRVLSDITAEIQRQDFADVSMAALPKKESILREIRYQKQKNEVNMKQKELFIEYIRFIGGGGGGLKHLNSSACIFFQSLSYH